MLEPSGEVVTVSLLDEDAWSDELVELVVVVLAGGTDAVGAGAVAVGAGVVAVGAAGAAVDRWGAGADEDRWGAGAGADEDRLGAGAGADEGDGCDRCVTPVGIAIDPPICTTGSGVDAAVGPERRPEFLGPTWRRTFADVLVG